MTDQYKWWEEDSFFSPEEALQKYGELDDISRILLRKYVWGNLLDAGCGVGINCKAIYDKVTSYTGLDITPRYIKFAKEINQSNCNFVVGSIEEIPFPDSSFDVSICRHVLEHIDGYQKALTELFRVSKYRVIVILFNPLTPNPSRLTPIMDFWTSPTGFCYRNNTYDRSEFTQFIRKYGIIKEQKILTYKLNFENEFLVIDK